MPRIFDNIELKFLPSLEELLGTAHSADFCVGYFNLRGWDRLGRAVEERFTGEGSSKCRLLIGMQTIGDQEIRQAYSLIKEDGIDNAKAIQLRKKMAEQFRQQLTIGAPTEKDELNLQRLARQLRTGKLQVKLFLRNTLHAKLYLVHRSDIAAPSVVYERRIHPSSNALASRWQINLKFHRRQLY